MKLEGRRQSRNVQDLTSGGSLLGRLVDRLQTMAPVGFPTTQHTPATDNMLAGMERTRQLQSLMTHDEKKPKIGSPDEPFPDDPTNRHTQPSNKVAGFMSSGKSKSGRRSRGRQGSVAVDAMNYGISAFGKIGMNRNQAIGALASLAGESGLGLDPNARNPDDPGTSEGIGQWNNSGQRTGRKSNMRSYVSSWAKAKGLDPATMSRLDKQKAQIDFHVHELTTTHKSALAAIKNAKTAAQATKAHTVHYEAPKIDNSAARAKNIGIINAALAGTTPPAAEDVGTTASVVDDGTSTTTESKPAKAESKSIFGSIVDSLSAVGDEALGVGTNAVDKATANADEKAGFLDGDVNFGTIAGSIAGGLVGGPIGSMLGGILGNAVHNALSRDPEDATSGILGDDENGILGGLGRALDGLGADVGSAFGGDGHNSNTAAHDPFGGGESGGFGAAFGGRSSSDTNQSGGRQGTGVHGLGQSEQAGNHDSGTGGSGKGGNKGKK